MISVCSVVLNEEKNIAGMIEACLPFLGKDDELVIVDGGSTDKTIDIISSFINDFPSKISFIYLKQNWTKREWRNEADIRNKAISFCKNDWILSLDADEAYSEKFYSKIPSILVDNADKLVFYFPTVNFFGSTKKCIDLAQWPDLHIRLFNKKHCKWFGKIHASVWHKSGTVFNPLHPYAKLLDHYLFHYARVKEDVNRPYGDIPCRDLIPWFINPRKEFD